MALVSLSACKYNAHNIKLKDTYLHNSSHHSNEVLHWICYNTYYFNLEQFHHEENKMLNQIIPINVGIGLQTGTQMISLQMASFSITTKTKMSTKTITNKAQDHFSIWHPT
jgi:hypothetical protein